jgi:hypothetical protein
LVWHEHVVLGHGSGGRRSTLSRHNSDTGQDQELELGRKTAARRKLVQKVVFDNISRIFFWRSFSKQLPPVLFRHVGRPVQSYQLSPFSSCKFFHFLRNFNMLRTTKFITVGGYSLFHSRAWTKNEVLPYLVAPSPNGKVTPQSRATQ